MALSLSQKYITLISLIGAIFLLEACDDQPATSEQDQAQKLDLSTDQMMKDQMMPMMDMQLDQNLIDQKLATDQNINDQDVNDQNIIDQNLADQILDAFLEPQCKDGIDNDGDGLTDYPRDPSCESNADHDESNTELACADQIDNDGDGLIDLDDLGCFGAEDQSEFNQCLSHDVIDISNQSRVVVDSEGAPSLLEACRSNNAPEQVFIFTLREPVSLLEFNTKGSALDTYLSVRRVCDDVNSELACNDDINNQDRSSLIQLSSPPLGDYFIIVDAFGDTQGRMVLNTQALIEDGQPCRADQSNQLISCGLGSVCIDGTCQKSICSDGIDNNGNGIFDYPNDPGCESARDQDETVPEILPACADGLDNDRDGRSDYPNDPQCTSAGYTQETPKVACQDGLDNDSDGWIDLDDPGCMNDPFRPSEFNSPACSDAIDNDGDGRTDYPNDPGCLNNLDNNERNIGDLPQCADGIDNDQDGQSDFPDDRNSCADAADQTEDNPCERRTIREITGLSSTRGNSIEENNDFSGSCGGGQGKESIVKWVVAQDRPLRSITFSTENSDIDTILYLKNQCDGAEIACNDNTAIIGNASRITLNNQAAGTEIYLVVDSRTANGGIWRMQIDLALEENAKCSGGGAWQCAQGLACLEQIDGVQRCVAPACGNGRDDDQDSYTDYPNDPGCTAFADVSERDPGIAPTCFNLVDDDGDSKSDFPADPDCESASDPSEAPACADGIDNDLDGFTDFSGMGFPDSSCVCANGSSEEQRMACADGCDNDQDGLIDLEDPGCASTNDNNETHTPQCRDNIDNNQDGRLDYPRDPGCTASNDPLENTLNPLPACGNGLDDDQDGLIDYPYDGGCVAASADSEISACNDLENAQMTGKFNILPNDGILLGNTSTLTPSNAASCTSGNANDAIVKVDVPYPAQIVANTFASAFNTTLYARSSCHAYQPCVGMNCPAVPSGTELTCNQDVNGTIQSAITLDRYQGDLYLFVDGFGLQSGAFQLQVLGTYGLNQICGPHSPAYLQCANGMNCVLEPMLNEEICRPIQPVCERRSPVVFGNTVDIQLPVADASQADFVGSCGGRGADHLIEWQHQGLVFKTLSFMIDDSTNQTVLYQKQSCDGVEMACVQSNQMLDFNMPNPNENITLVVDQLQAGQVENWRLVVNGELAEGSKCGSQIVFACEASTTCVDDDQNGEGVCTLPPPPPPPPPPTPKQCDNQLDDDLDQLIDLLDPECVDANDDDESL